MGGLCVRRHFDLSPPARHAYCRRLVSETFKRRSFKTNTWPKLESSRSPHTSAKAMLFARWQHHLRLCSGFPYAPLKTMVTKIWKWSRIQDFFRITPKIEPLIACAIPDMPSKFQKDLSITFWVILLTHRQTNRQTKSGKNITSLAEVIIQWKVRNRWSALLIGAGES